MNDLVPVNPKKLHLIKITNPFTKRDREYSHVNYFGESLLELRNENYPLDVQVKVSVNGKVIPTEQLSSYYLREFDQVIFLPDIEGGGGGGKSILRIVAMIAIAAVAYWATPLIMGTTWAGIAAAGGWSALGAGLIAGTITAVGGLLVNLLLPIPMPDTDAETASQNFSWNPMTRQVQGIPIPMIYGSIKTFGNVVATQVQHLGKDDVLYALIGLCEGPIESISGIKINDQDLPNLYTPYHALTISHRSGYIQQQSVPDFGYAPNTESLGSPYGVEVIYGSPQQRTTTTNPTSAFSKITIQIRFPMGLVRYDDEGDKHQYGVNVRVRYRGTDATGWTNITASPEGDVVLYTYDSSSEYYLRGLGYWTTWNGKGRFWCAELEEWKWWRPDPENPEPVPTHGDDEGEKVWVGAPWNAYMTIHYIHPGEKYLIGGSCAPFDIITNSTTENFRISYDIEGLNPTKNYVLEVAKMTEETTDDKIIDNMYWEEWTEYSFTDPNNKTEGFTYPRLALAVIKALAVEKLSGSMNFSCKVHGKHVCVYDGTTWWLETSKNPAWIAYDIISRPSIRDTQLLDRHFSAWTSDNSRPAVWKRILAADTVIGEGNAAISPDTTNYRRSSPGLKIDTTNTFIAVGWNLSVSENYKYNQDTRVRNIISKLTGNQYFEIWAKCSTASRVRAVIKYRTGSWTTATGSYHTGSGNWERLSVTANIPTDMTAIYFGVQVTNGTLITAYVDEAWVNDGTALSHVYRYDGYDTSSIILNDFLSWASYCDEEVPDGRIGNKLTTATGAGATTIELGSTADFTTTTGTGYVFDTTSLYTIVYRDTFTWGGKDATRLTGCSGLDAHNAGAFVCPSYAVERRFTFNGIFDTGTALWDALLKVGIVGRGCIILTGTKIGVVVDRPTAPTQLFSMGNIVEGSFRETFLPLLERASELEVDFMNKDNNYEREVLHCLNSSLTQVPVAQMTLFGVTKPSEAWRAARYRLACNEHLLRTVEFSANVDAIACTLGDVINFQHDVPSWSDGGRILNSDASSVTLDKTVAFDATNTYQIMVRDSSTDTLTTKTVISVSVVNSPIPNSPSVSRAIISGTWTKNPVAYDDVYIYGLSTSLTKKLRVLAIEREEQSQDCHISTIEYNEDVYLTDYNINQDLKGVWTDTPVPRTIPSVRDLSCICRSSPMMGGSQVVADLSWRSPIFDTSQYFVATGTQLWVRQVPTTPYTDTSELSNWGYIGQLPANINSYTHSTVTYGKTYQFAVCTVTAEGIQDIADAAQVTKTMTFDRSGGVPATPTGLAVTALYNSLSYTWNPVTTYTDGTPCNEIAGYEGYVKRTIDATYGAASYSGNSIGFIYAGSPSYTYTGKVRAYTNLGMFSAFTSDVTATPLSTPTDDTVAPNVPVNLTLTSGVTQTSDGNAFAWVQAAWNDNTESDLSYYMCRIRAYDGTYSYTTTSVSRNEWSPVRPATWYFVSVAATDKNGNRSAYTSDKSIYTAVDVTPPGPPTDFSITAVFTSLHLEWTNPTDKDFQHIEVWRASANNRGTAARVSTTKSDFWIDPIGVADQTRYYWIRAVDYADLSSTWNPVDASAGKSAITFASGGFTWDSSAPVTPIGLTLTTGSSQDSVGGEFIWLRADWSNNAESDLAFYEWRIKEGTGGNYGYGYTGESEHLFQPVKGNAWYFVGVRAVDELSNKSSWTSDKSIYSADDTVAPNVPTSVTATGGFQLIWVAWTNPTDTDLAYIEIYRNSVNDSTTSSLLATSTGTFYINHGLGDGTTRYYWLKAVDEAGNKSAFSSGASATTVYIQGGDFDTVSPEVPAGLTLTTGCSIDGGGKEYVWVRGDWVDSTHTDKEGYEYRIKDGPSGNYTYGYVTASDVLFAPVRSNTSYYMGVRSMDVQGNKSNFCTDVSIMSARDTGAPSAPSAFTATSAFKNIYLNWTNPTDSDFACTEIWRNTSNDRTTSSKIAEIAGNFLTDGTFAYGTTMYYWIRAKDWADNTSTWVGSVNATTGTVQSTDINDFAITASKIFTKIPILSGDTWEDQTPSAGYVRWNAHSLYYNGALYSISGSNTNSKYIYWTGGTSYSVSNTNPTLTDSQFIIAVNISGAHDLAWNAIANQVIGSAYIEDAAIVNAKIANAAIDNAKLGNVDASHITSGSIDAGRITVIEGSTLIDGTAASTIAGRADDPATRINTRPVATYIQPGRIWVDGSTTTLADWRYGGNWTKIDGGDIAAGSITANLLSVGTRNISVQGIEISANYPVANRVYWTSGIISYMTDAATFTDATITSGSADRTGGTLWLYWVQNATTISTSYTRATALDVSNVVIGSYRGGTDLIANWGRTIIDGEDILTRTITADRIFANTLDSSVMRTDVAVITASAQIADAIITSAKIGTLDASKITSGNIDTARIQVNAAAAVNAGSTNISPGRIWVDGSSTLLQDWRYGGNWSLIDGGDIAANTITANKITIGARNISVQGIEFSADYPTPSRVYWTAGAISYRSDTGVVTEKNIDANSTGALWSSGTLYIYWVKDTTVLATNNDKTTAFNENNFVLATYRGGSVLAVSFGRTIIDGDGILTRSITADRIATNTLDASVMRTDVAIITGTAQISNAIINNAHIVSVAADKITAGSITSKAITLAVTEGTGDVKIQADKTDFGHTRGGFILGMDDSDGNKAKFEIGDANKYMKWTGSDLLIKGGLIRITSGGYTDGTPVAQIGDAVHYDTSDGLMYRGDSMVRNNIIGVKDAAGNIINNCATADFTSWMPAGTKFYLKSPELTTGISFTTYSASYNLNSNTTNKYRAQRFTTAATDAGKLITGCALVVMKTGSPYPMVIQLTDSSFNGTNYVPNNVLAVSEPSRRDEILSAYSSVSVNKTLFRFSTPYKVSASTSYHLVATVCDETCDPANYYDLGYGTGYAGGEQAICSYAGVWGGFTNDLIFWVDYHQTITAVEQITDGGFEVGLTNWALTFVGGAATVSRVTSPVYAGTYAAQIVVTTAGAGYNAVQYEYQPNIVLQSGSPYTVSYALRANANRTVQVVMTTSNDPLRSVGIVVEVWTENLTTSYQLFTKTLQKNVAKYTWIEFWVGGSVSTVQIDAVSILPTKNISSVHPFEYATYTTALSPVIKIGETTPSGSEFYINVQKTYPQIAYEDLLTDFSSPNVLRYLPVANPFFVPGERALVCWKQKAKDSTSSVRTLPRFNMVCGPTLYNYTHYTTNYVEWLYEAMPVGAYGSTPGKVTLGFMLMGGMVSRIVVISV